MEENSKTKRIMIAGVSTLGSATARELTRAVVDAQSERGVVIVNDNPDDYGKVRIEGKEYQLIEKDNEKPSLLRNSKFGSMLAMAEMMNDMFYNTPQKKPRERPYVNIIEEFTLIQQKKSKLSRSDREWLVREFNSKFKEVSNELR